jgi:Transmembrane protein 254
MSTGTATFRPVAPYWWITNFGGIVVNGIIASRSKKRLVRFSFALGAGYHVIAAGYAYYAAHEAGLDDDAWKWGLQTLGVGTPSLRALNTVIRERTVDA